MSSIACTAKASYKKHSGILELTDTALQWTQDGKKNPQVRVALTEASSLFCSKATADEVKLKIATASNDKGHNFTFINQPQNVAFEERERFKKELTAIIANNKAKETNGAVPAPPGGLALPTPSVLPTPSPGTPLANGLAKSALGPRAPVIHSRAPSVSSERSSTIVAADPHADFNLRKKVLQNNPELAALHRDLVMTEQISEAEFWDGREHLLLAQQAADKQRKGKPGQLVDPRPETDDKGIKIRITPQLVHDIFDEYPVVAKAYDENVPKNFSEEEFWARYFQSKLFHKHRASIRSVATQHVVKDDPIFDAYLEPDDDGIEPRKQREERPDLFIDLGATNEDHGETTIERDVTMQAGRQKGALPLIRKFNEHSERLLNSALGEGPAAKRRKIHDGDIYQEIEYDDLRGVEESAGIVLEMQDRQRYFDGLRTDADGTQDPSTKLNPTQTRQEARAGLEGWESNLHKLKIERTGGDNALISMTKNVASRLDVRSKKNDIPESLFRQMTSCQTAANEFLRQYWSAVLPPAADGPPTTAVSTPAQRATKAAKMIGYLGNTQAKVDAIVNFAQQHGMDAGRISTAMKPVLDAVNHALASHRAREAVAASPKNPLVRVQSIR